MWVLDLIDETVARYQDWKKAQTEGAKGHGGSR